MTKKTKEVKVTADAFQYDVSALLENCEAITGRKKEVGEGALFGNKSEKMTKVEFKKKVDDFLKKKVNKPLKKEVK